MANVGHGTARQIIDSDGDVVGVTGNALDVHLKTGVASIDIGDVSLLLDGTAADYGTGNVNTSGRTLRVTLANDDPAVTALELIGDAIYVDDADWDGSSKHMLVGGLYGSNTITSGDVGPIALAADGAVHIDDGGNTITVDGTVAVNTISGFATESKQPSLGTAGSASANVITVQGIASMTPLTVDLAGNNDVTITSGTVTANAGTNLNTSALATHAKQDTIITHLSEIEGAVETIEAAVDTQMQVDVVAISAQSDGTYIGDIKFGEALPAGTNAIGKLSANDGVDIGDVDITSIAAGDNNIGNVDIASALPAGSNAIGKLAANSGVDIGDVDVTSISAGTNAIGKVGHDITGMVSGVNNAVGTGVEDLVGSGSVAIKRIDLFASSSNTGYIWVGDSSVANDGTGGGVRLGAGDFYSMDIDDLNKVHVAATVADEDIMYTYYT